MTKVIKSLYVTKTYEKKAYHNMYGVNKYKNINRKIEIMKEVTIKMEDNLNRQPDKLEISTEMMIPLNTLSFLQCVELIDELCDYLKKKTL